MRDRTPGFCTVLLTAAFLTVAVPAFAANQRTGNWSPAGTMAQARSGAAAVLLPDDRVLVIGGASSDGPLSTVEVFKDGVFSSVASMNNPRAGHTAVVLADGRVLVAGGRTAGGVATTSAEVYDARKDRWSLLRDMNHARVGHTATVLNDGRVLIAGGQNGDVTDTLEIFDPVSDRFVAVRATLSSPRRNHAAARLPDGRVLIIGGDDGEDALESTNYFDPATNKIAEGPDLATPRTGLSATTLLNGDVLVVGGNDGKKDLASAELYSVETEDFEAARCMLAQARRDPIAIRLPKNNSVLIVGGILAGAPTQWTELYRPWAGNFNLASRLKTAISEFTPSASLNEPRGHAAAAALAREGELLVSGGEGKASAEIYAYSTIDTDKPQYASGDPVTISGSGWQPGETVTLRIQEDPKVNEDRVVTTAVGSDGNLTPSTFNVKTQSGLVYVTAVGSLSQGQTRFSVGVNTTPGPTCTPDEQGPDDQPGQKDLTQMCSLGACTGGSSISFNFDNTDWSGMNTGDACALFDLNGNGNADKAVCVTITGDVGTATTSCYTCGDTAPDRCTSPVPQPCSSTCTVSPGPDPFAGNPNHTANKCSGPSCLTLDASVTCCVSNANDGGTLLDVCTIPSSQPNSDPSDCIISKQCNSNSDCDDGNPCTDDTCDPTFHACRHVDNTAPCSDDGNQCTNDVCSAGVCTHPNKTDGTTCNDGNACTQSDTCQAGVCTGSNPVVCTASDQCHVAGTCDPQTGACSNPTAPDGTACNDGNACTQTDTCQSGVCTGSNPVTCSAQDQCHTAGTCNPSTGVCSNPAKTDGTACNDGNACTQTDTCQSGVCTGSNPVTCTASDQCHVAGTCDPGTGQCSNPTATNGTACNDGNACTQADTCQSGVCVGSNPVICTASDQCHVAGTCDPGTGQCSNPTATNGTACNDGNACTQTDTCQSGVCTGSNPVTCTASDQCHVAGTCNPSTGQCSNPAATNGTACNDGNACTQTDTCQSGVCVGSNPVICTASDQCHVAGVCNPSTGACSNPTAPDNTPCNDQNACTSGDFCQNGQCTGSNTCGATSTQTCFGPKFTGGGQFLRSSEKWSFGFNAKGTVGGTASGHFNAIDHTTGAQINGDVTAITCFNGTDTMTFQVTTKEGCLYQITVHDGGEPGRSVDNISITKLNGSCTAQAPGTNPLDAGNIQSH